MKIYTAIKEGCYYLLDPKNELGDLKDKAISSLISSEPLDGLPESLPACLPALLDNTTGFKFLDLDLDFDDSSDLPFETPTKSTFTPHVSSGLTPTKLALQSLNKPYLEALHFKNFSETPHKCAAPQTKEEKSPCNCALLVANLSQVELERFS